ncbi:MAG: hypothetical protein LBV71_17705 [Prevotella sp.]|jgi:hypothetical protein|nr:hypothetical protein [Prevotella sp.]
MPQSKSDIIQKLLDHIPKELKPVQYLVDLLDISNESVYRRMKGEVSFSFDEIIKLSHELGFSVDELISEDGGIASFELLANSTTSYSDTFLNILKLVKEHLNEVAVSGDTETINAWNHLPPIFLVKCDHLFKFRYFKWLHQGADIPSNRMYSDVIVPSEILSLKEQLISDIKTSRNVISVMGPSIFLNLIKEIQYYYIRKLITDEEKAVLKEDLYKMIDIIEKLVQDGKFNEEGKISYYLSSLEIDTNTIYVQYDTKEVCIFWVVSMPPIFISNKEVCTVQKKWLESLMKYSTLITSSNELMQSEFFRKQREYVKNMDNITFPYR